MPASKVRADHDALAHIAQSFARQADCVGQSLQSIQGAKLVLENGDWIGRGATRFYQEMDSAVLPAFSRLVQALERAAETTIRISQVLTQAEEETAWLFSLEGDTGTPAVSGVTADKFSAQNIARPIIGPSGVARVVGVFPNPDGTERVIYTSPESGAWLSYTRQAPADAREAEIQSLIDRAHLDPKPENFQKAIDAAIKLYDIDVNPGRGKPTFDPLFPLEAGETVYPTREIHIGKSAFTSPGFLAATIHHEMLHAYNIEEHWPIDPRDQPQVWALEHVRVYDQELSYAQKYRLRKHEIAELHKLRTLYYDQLTPDNQKRADSGDYTFPH